ncbi:hypothetical protein KKC1_31990, partial [Calderihabitans maritimus]
VLFIAIFTAALVP